MESVMNLETSPTVTQAMPHPTQSSRPVDTGKPLTRVNLPPGPAVPHDYGHQSLNQAHAFGPVGSAGYSGQVNLNTPDLVEKPPLPKRKPGRPKGTGKKLTSSDQKHAPKSKSRIGSVEAPSASYSNRDIHSSSTRCSIQDGASGSSAPQASTSAAVGTTAPASTSRESISVATSGQKSTGRPRKDELPAGSLMRVRPITPPPTEYVYNPSYTANRPPNPNSPRIPDVDPPPDLDAVLAARPKGKPPGKPRKPMPGKKVGRPKTNRDPAIMLKELLEEQERKRKEKEGANSQTARQDQEQGDHPAGFSYQSREGDSRFYPPSVTNTSDKTSSASPPTPLPYALSQHPLQSDVGVPVECTSDAHNSYGGEWYPPAFQKEPITHDYSGSMPTSSTGYEHVHRQDSVPEGALYSQAPYQQPPEDQVLAVPSSESSSHGLGINQLPPPFSQNEEPPPYHSHEYPSSASTPPQDRTQPSTKIELAALIVGTLVDLFPVTPSLNKALQTELLKHVSETLLIDTNDGTPAFYSSHFTLNLPYSEPYFHPLTLTRTLSGRLLQNKPIQRFIYWDPLVLSWSYGDTLHCPTCQEGILEHRGIHDKVMRIFDVPYTDVQTEAVEHDTKAFYVVGSRYACNSQSECVRRDWASWNSELIITLPLNMQLLSPVEHIFDLDGTLPEEDGVLPSIGGFGLSRALWKSYCAASSIIPDGVMDKETCLRFLGNLFGGEIDALHYSSLHPVPQEAYQQPGPSNVPYADSADNTSWSHGTSVPGEQLSHQLDALPYSEVENSTSITYQNPSVQTDHVLTADTYGPEPMAPTSYTRESHSVLYGETGEVISGPNCLQQDYSVMGQECHYVNHSLPPPNDAGYQVGEDASSSSLAHYSVPQPQHGAQQHPMLSNEVSYQGSTDDRGDLAEETLENSDPQESIPDGNYRGSPLLSLNASLPSMNAQPPTISYFPASRDCSRPSSVSDTPSHPSPTSNLAESMPKSSFSSSTLPSKRPLSSLSSDVYTGSAKKVRHCCKCGEQSCKGKGGSSFCLRACRDCGDPGCKGRNSRRPDWPCTRAWSGLQ